MNAKQFETVKRQLRRTAAEALERPDWGDDSDNFHDFATPQNVIELLDRLEQAEASRAELLATLVLLTSPATPEEQTANHFAALEAIARAKGGAA